MEREAFARAWRYLSYDPVGKWTALLAAFGTGVLYVALLGVLGLFADLAVSRGRIPAYRDLLVSEQERFQYQWQELTPEEARRVLLVGAGVDEKVAGELAQTPFERLTAPEQGLAWRAYLHHLLSTRVGPAAGLLVLPTYRDLPPRAQAALLTQWQALSGRDRDTALEKVGVEDTRHGPLVNADPEKVTLAERELLWHALLVRRVEEEFGPTAAENFWHDRAQAGFPEADRDTLGDRGILRLVVRSRDRYYGNAVSRLAYWNPWMWRQGNGTYLAGLAVLAIVLAFVRATLMALMTYMAARATIEATTRMRRAVYHHTYRLGTLAFRALGPSEAVSISTRHLEAIDTALYTWLTVVFREPVKFALVLVFALLVNFWLALAFLCFALLVWLVGGLVAAYYRRQGRIALRQAAEHLVLIQESLMIMRLVKTYLMELFNQARVERQLARYGRVRLRLYRGEAIYRPLLVFLGVVAAAILLYVTGLVVLSGQLGVASGITLATALVSLYWPAASWLEHRRHLRRGAESAVLLFKFLDRPGEVGQVVGAEFLPPLSRFLEFDNVNLREPGTDRMLLQGVSLTVQAGQRVAIVGPDEMEKHALVYLLPRFLDPSTGEIRIDEHNLRWVTLDSLRAQMALVLQHNLVFNDTVANNIGCGDPSYSLPQLIEAAKVAHAHQFIQKLPQGYDTPIGEMGQSLSISEQFRIALARAILRDPAVLIIEEPMIQLDPESKALLDDTFARVLPGRTTLFLPHRISTIKGCDRVFLLHRGRIVASGSHRELLAENDLYRHLHYLEFSELTEQVGG